MSTIFVTGHRNPDMDSIAAAISYSALKNELDSGNHYIPVALGPLNTQSHAMLESLGLPDPLFVKDVYSRVSAVYRKPTLTVAPDDPVYELVNMYNQNNPSVVPIMDGSVFKGLLSIDEINRYFLRENMDSRPVYDILLKNIPRVIKGFFLKKCSQNMVHGPIMVGAMDYKVFCHRLAGCPEKPILVVGNRQDHIRAAFKEQLPGIILTGMDEDSLQSIDTSEYDGFVYVSHEDTAETIRLLLRPKMLRISSRTTFLKMSSLILLRLRTTRSRLTSLLTRARLRPKTATRMSAPRLLRAEEKPVGTRRTTVSRPGPIFSCV